MPYSTRKLVPISDCSSPITHPSQSHQPQKINVLSPHHLCFHGKFTNPPKQPRQLPEAPCKNGVRKDFAIFTTKHLFLIVCNFIKKRLQYSYFSMNIAMFLRTPTLKNICEDCYTHCFFYKQRFFQPSVSVA